MRRGALSCLVLTVASIRLAIALHAQGQGASDGPAPTGRRWIPMPLFRAGPSVALLLGDPLREPAYMHVKFPPGYEPPLHSHTATERILVERGTLILHLQGRDSVAEPEGSYFVIKNGTVHETACVGPAECLCYISIDRALDMIPFPKHDPIKRHDSPTRSFKKVRSEPPVGRQ